MTATTIVGYAYDAAIYCPSCAREDHEVSYFKIGKADPSIDQHRLPCEMYDREGNKVTPVFSGEDAVDQYCEDCLCQITE